MRISPALHSLAAFSCGSLGTYVGIKLLYRPPPSTKSSELEEPVPKYQWIHDWDCREFQLNNVDRQEGGNESTALRHIVLVRHGEYNSTPSGNHLTNLGRRQAYRTGQRLREMGITWDHVVASTMTRAQETAMIILKQINFDPLKMKRCDLLPEGTPCPADPPQNRSPAIIENSYRRDGPRIEAAFRRYFFRASPDQKDDSYLLIIGHANVIRYLVCRALQLPSEAWTRFNLHHSSITWLTIWPTGYVTLRCMSDTGYMPVKEMTHRRPLSNPSSPKTST